MIEKIYANYQYVQYITNLLYFNFLINFNVSNIITFI
jgi:hypothetical protein